MNSRLRSAEKNSSVRQSTGSKNTEGKLDKIEVKLDKISEQLATLTKSHEFLSAKYDEAVSEIIKLTQANQKLNKAVENLSRKYDELSVEVDQLKAKSNESDQHKVGANVLIRNLKADEDATMVIKKIGQLSSIEIKEGDITSAKQLKDSKNQPIIVAKFRDNAKKMQFVKAAKKLKLSTASFGYGTDPMPVYVDEQLTKTTFLLFKRAKELKKVGVKFVWISNGEILVRKDENELVSRIVSETQIQGIENELLVADKTNPPTTSKKKQRQ